MRGGINIFTTKEYRVTGGAAEVTPDGSIKILNLTLSPVTESNLTLENIWLPSGQISYMFFIGALRSHSIIDAHNNWLLFKMRGARKTCSHYVRGLYETLLLMNCITEQTWPDVQLLFNNSFNCGIASGEVLRNKEKCRNESAYFESVLGKTTTTPIFSNHDQDDDI